MLHYITVVLCVLFAVSSGQFADEQPKYLHRVEDVDHSLDEDTIFRLPTTVIPSKYDVWIKTEIDQELFDFNGNVKIDLRVTEVTKQIVFHGKRLVLGNAILTNADGIQVALADWSINNTTQLITVEAEENLAVGDYNLEIEFRGALRLDNLGFYRSSYQNSEGRTVWLATTQFEAMDARHGFPCFDEPSFKATFIIRLEHSCNLNAISNTNGVTTISPTNPNICTTVFEETPIMSTYLLAYVISDFNFKSNYDGTALPDRLKHRVFGVESRLEQAQFALGAGEEILDGLAEYTGIPFGISKMDQIAIPDFYFGAMENWGLVTYTSNGFFVDYVNDMYTQEERVAVLIAHEFAHQWFGNYVTLEWWAYIWLNEGFATLFENYIIDQVYDGKYDRINTFAVRTLQSIMQSDALDSTRAMNYMPTDMNTIMNLFDNVAYDKSGTVLRMLMFALTEPVFKQGLNYYLTARALQNSHPTHLYAGLQQAVNEVPGTLPAGITVESVMNTWADQKGFPILTVNYNNENGQIIINQERYLATGPEPAPKTIWQVPYNFITYSERYNEDLKLTKPDGWLRTETTTLEPSTERDWTGDRWIIFNQKQTGYYRVNYNLENWAALTKELKYDLEPFDNSRQITPRYAIDHNQRAQLVDDSLELARTGRLPYSVALDLVLYLSKYEDHFYAWESANSGLNRLDNLIFGSEFHNGFLNYTHEIFHLKFANLGVVETESDNTLYHLNQMRRNIMEWACKSNVTECLTATHKALIAEMDEGIRISPYLRATVIKNGLRNTDRETFFKILLQESQGTTARRTEIFAALAHTFNGDIRKEYLATLLLATGETLEGIDLAYTAANRVNIMNAMLNAHLDGYNDVIAFLTENVDAVKVLIPNQANINTIMSNLATRTATQENLEKLKLLLALYDVTPTLYEVRAEANIEWVDNLGETIKEFLVEKQYWSGASAIIVSSFLIFVSVITVWFTSG